MSDLIDRATEAAKVAGMSNAAMILELRDALAAAERERDEARQDGIRQAFDYIMHATANNYSFDPEEQKRRDRENQWAESMALDMLDDLARDFRTKWKDLREALDRAKAAEAREKALMGVIYRNCDPSAATAEDAEIIMEIARAEWTAPTLTPTKGD